MPGRPTAPSTARLLQACWRIREALQAGERPTATPEELPCFAPAAVEGDPSLTPASLQEVLGALTPADIPTFEVAIAAIQASQKAWLGFKLVTDPAAALDSEDTDVVGLRGKGRGSADARPGAFVVLNPTGEQADAQIVFSRPISQRDRFQMLDVTRGPSMHSEQYAGVAWTALPLFHQVRVFLLGASTVAAEVARAAARVDFQTVAVDYDPAYLNAERFPRSRRVQVEGFEALPDLGIGPDDYVCVLTRGHMHDPPALIHGVRAGACYVGMLGSAEKNERVFALAEQAGVPRAALEATHTPIGLRFGARTPAELALAIVAELIQVRDQRRRAAAP